MQTGVVPRSRPSRLSTILVALALTFSAGAAVVTMAAPAQAVANNQFAWPATGHTDANDVAWHRAHENGARAVDIQALVGTAVGAAQSGVVVTANTTCGDVDSWGCGHGFGNYVIVRHDRTGVTNPLYTLYGHLASASVIANNSTVTTGQKVGTIALSGSTTGAHTHFAIGTCPTVWSLNASTYDTNCTVWSGADTTSTTATTGNAVPGEYGQLVNVVPPPAGNGTDTFGSYNPNTATFYISNAMTPGAAEATFMYGNAGWVPLIGDWNGDGVDTFGTYNPATATFYITNSMSPSVAEAVFQFGNAGWIPLVGDWDGNRTDTFGAYNPATATFYISNAMTPGAAEAVFQYGNAGWTPLVGDWDGNGTDTFGSYNPNTATFYISNALSPGAAEAVFCYGNAGWTPLIGDWNGDRIDTFGAYNPATATFYISNAMTPGAAEATFMYGNAGWTPLVGDWNGQ